MASRWASGGAVSVTAGKTTGDNQVGGGVTITADDMDLDGTITASAGSQTVLLKSKTAADTIDLGDAADADPGVLELSSAELANVTATTLQVGAAAAGAVTGPARRRECIKRHHELSTHR